MIINRYLLAASNIIVIFAIIHTKILSSTSLPDDDYLDYVPTYLEEIPVEVIQQYLQNETSFFLDESECMKEKKRITTSKIEKASMAKCEPELISVDCHQDTRSIQNPSCIRVKRCGGCCNHNLLSCQPTQVQNRLFEIAIRYYEGNNKFSKIHKSFVELEEHLACKCGCKIQESNCNEMQIYDARRCVCQCKNLDDFKKCSKLSQKQFLWDPEICQCKCRHSDECPSWSYFNDNTCECVRSRNVTSSKRLSKPNNYSSYSRNRDKYYYATKYGSGSKSNESSTVSTTL